MNILIFGTSITWGAWDDKGGYAQRLKSYFDAKTSLSNYNNYNEVYCLGVSGDTTKELLQRFETELKARLSQESEAFVLIEIGINDSLWVLSEEKHLISPQDFKNNLLKLIKIGNALNVKIAFLGLTPVDNTVDPLPWDPTKSYRMEFVQKYDNTLKEVCIDSKIDHISIMQEFEKKKYSDLLTDGVHPNPDGHKLIFEEVKKFLLK